ncbi:MAG: hypothetical protein HYY09_01120 [Firmicutes bacterium]|nr:hypothetical protein [Bacillota bacterium]
MISAAELACLASVAIRERRSFSYVSLGDTEVLALGAGDWWSPWSRPDWPPWHGLRNAGYPPPDDRKGWGRARDRLAGALASASVIGIPATRYFEIQELALGAITRACSSAGRPVSVQLEPTSVPWDRMLLADSVAYAYLLDSGLLAGVITGVQAPSLLLVGNHTPAWKLVLEAEGALVSAVVAPVKGLAAVDETLDRCGEKPFDLALVSAGAAGVLLCPAIAHRFGLPALDCGKVAADMSFGLRTLRPGFPTRSQPPWPLLIEADSSGTGEATGWTRRGSASWAGGYQEGSRAAIHLARQTGYQDLLNQLVPPQRSWPLGVPIWRVLRAGSSGSGESGAGKHETGEHETGWPDAGSFLLGAAEVTQRIDDALEYARTGVPGGFMPREPLTPGWSLAILDRRTFPILADQDDGPMLLQLLTKASLLGLAIPGPIDPPQRPGGSKELGRSDELGGPGRPELTHPEIGAFLAWGRESPLRHWILGPHGPSGKGIAVVETGSAVQRAFQTAGLPPPSRRVMLPDLRQPGRGGLEETAGRALDGLTDADYRLVIVNAGGLSPALAVLIAESLRAVVLDLGEIWESLSRPWSLFAPGWAGRYLRWWERMGSQHRKHNG